jgi:hypothetical protein
MSVDHADDPWTKVTSKRGFPADELISTLQKSIRRGLLEDALMIAREMYETSPELEEHLWTRLCVISCEDTGDGSFFEPVLINNLYDMHTRIPRSMGDRWLFAVHAVRFLASRTKDRTSDELANWVVLSLASGTRQPVIPEWALDVHTRRGREAGKDVLHFWNEASQVTNEKADRDTSYRGRVLDLLTAESEAS